MPQAEVRRDAGMYSYLDRVNQTNAAFLQAFFAARGYLFRDSDPAHLTPSQIAQQIDLTQAALVALYNQGTTLRNFNLDYPDFVPAPTTTDLLGMMHDPNPAATRREIEENLERQRLADELKDSSQK
jgi:hypothetical protein